MPTLPVTIFFLSIAMNFLSHGLISTQASYSICEKINYKRENKESFIVLRHLDSIYVTVGMGRQRPEYSIMIGETFMH